MLQNKGMGESPIHSLSSKNYKDDETTFPRGNKPFVWKTRRAAHLKNELLLSLSGEREDEKARLVNSRGGRVYSPKEREQAGVLAF